MLKKIVSLLFLLIFSLVSAAQNDLKNTFQKTEITDIAPTLSALLGISFPNFTID